MVFLFQILSIKLVVIGLNLQSFFPKKADNEELKIDSTIKGEAIKPKKLSRPKVDIIAKHSAVPESEKAKEETKKEINPNQRASNDPRNKTT